MLTNCSSESQEHVLTLNPALQHTALMSGTLEPQWYENVCVLRIPGERTSSPLLASIYSDL